MSFGARALRDVKTGNGVGNNGRVSVKLASPPPAQGRGLSSTHASTDKHPRIVSDYSEKSSGEGINWSEKLRSSFKRGRSLELTHAYQNRATKNQSNGTF